MMNLYHSAVVVRPREPGPDDSSESVLQGRIRAIDEHWVRRGVLETVWRKGFFVSYFLSIECIERTDERRDDYGW